MALDQMSDDFFRRHDRFQGLAEVAMREVRITCDGCGKQKGATNHWYFADQGELGFRVYRWPQSEDPVSATFHLCGENCAQKKLSEWMGKQ